MDLCSCPPLKLAGATKLRTIDERGRPITEHLVRAHGGRLLRARTALFEEQGRRRLKFTISEASDVAGDVRRGTDGGNLIFPGGVVGIGDQDLETATARLLERELGRAAWSAGLREALDYSLSGQGSPASSSCSTCGLPTAFADHSAEATHRDSNDVVVRTPRGLVARVRIRRVDAGVIAGTGGSGWVHLHLTVAHAIDATGDVTKEVDGSHRIVDCGVHSFSAEWLEVDWQTGRPRNSLSAFLADRILVDGITRLEGAVAARRAFDRAPFLQSGPIPITIADQQKALQAVGDRWSEERRTLEGELRTSRAAEQLARQQRDQLADQARNLQIALEGAQARAAVLEAEVAELTAKLAGGGS